MSLLRSYVEDHLLKKTVGNQQLLTTLSPWSQSLAFPDVAEVKWHSGDGIKWLNDIRWIHDIQSQNNLWSVFNISDWCNMNPRTYRYCIIHTMCVYRPTVISWFRCLMGNPVRFTLFKLYLGHRMKAQNRVCHLAQFIPPFVYSSVVNAVCLYVDL